jgi:hypothetical protein
MPAQSPQARCVWCHITTPSAPRLLALTLSVPRLHRNPPRTHHAPAAATPHATPIHGRQRREASRLPALAARSCGARPCRALACLACLPGLPAGPPARPARPACPPGLPACPPGLPGLPGPACLPARPACPARPGLPACLPARPCRALAARSCGVRPGPPVLPARALSCCAPHAPPCRTGRVGLDVGAVGPGDRRSACPAVCRRGVAQPPGIRAHNAQPRAGRCIPPACEGGRPAGDGGAGRCGGGAQRWRPGLRAAPMRAY